MSQNSAIEWTEATWNPVRGCVKVSPGCAHCYAETFAERWRGIPGHAYEQGFDLRLVPEKLSEPLKIKKPTTFFVNSMSDLFQDGVPDEYIDRVFAVMALSGQHTFQVLTKRAERMREYMTSRAKSATFWKSAAPLGWTLDDFHGIKMVPFPLPNVWLGVSVENQHWLQRIDELKDTPAAVRFVSFEPLLEDVGALVLDGIHWCIVGGESGPGARSFDLAWGRLIVRECRRQGVAVFVKQIGRWPLSHQNENDHGGQHWVPLFAKRGGQEPTGEYGLESPKRTKGGDVAEWPEDLRVREMPALAVR